MCIGVENDTIAIRNVWICWRRKFASICMWSVWRCKSPWRNCAFWESAMAGDLGAGGRSLMSKICQIVITQKIRLTKFQKMLKMMNPRLWLIRFCLAFNLSMKLGWCVCASMLHRKRYYVWHGAKQPCTLRLWFLIMLSGSNLQGGIRKSSSIALTLESKYKKKMSSKLPPVTYHVDFWMAQNKHG